VPPRAAAHLSQVDCYRCVTVYQTILRSLTDARYLIDKALTKTLSHRKPVLLEVCRCGGWAGAGPPLAAPWVAA
jgi:TPP-dependent 2-oxoacid decarboxylase